MKNIAKLLTLVISMGGLTLAAHADPIQGQISISGNDTYNSTSISFDGTGTASAIATTGTLSNLFAAGQTSASVDLNGFSFGSGFVDPTQVFSIDSNGTTVTLTLDSITASGVDSYGNLSVMGDGLLTETGYAPTEGSFDLTSQGGQGGAVVTFSATSQVTAVAPTPEPSSLLLLGTGLLGFAGIFYRRRNALLS